MIRAQYNAQGFKVLNQCKECNGRQKLYLQYNMEPQKVKAETYRMHFKKRPKLRHNGNNLGSHLS